MNPYCEAKPCPIILSTSCVFYEGGNLICTGINKNDTLEMALIKIDQAICSVSGTSGTSGTSGVSGSSGSSGATGSSGTSGSSGSAGTSGTTGSSGSSGSSGTAGSSGADGDRYRTPSYSTLDMCDPALIIVNTGLAYSVGQTIIIAHDSSHSFEATVTSYNPSTGELAFVNPIHCVGTGTYSSWIVNLAGASGGDGSSGTSGSSGLTGSAGTSGSSGFTGSSGSSGSSGFTGSNGTSGISGTNGTNGTSGLSGSSGTSGLTGTSGHDGTSGTSGSSGSHGTSGSSGVNGGSGSSGTSGSHGSSGTSGINGSFGTSGSSGRNGTSGSNGSSGSSGSNGSSGTSGSSGITGSNGTSGSSGTDGTGGTSGLTFSYKGNSTSCISLPLIATTTTSSSTTTTTTTAALDCTLEGTAIKETTTTTTTTTAYIPVTGLTWNLVDNITGVPSCQPAGWTVSNSNLNIRYDIANSVNCGGTCGQTQTGTATATVTVGGVDAYLNLDFNGIGEKELPDYEKIDFYLNGPGYLNIKLASAHAPGGNLGCQMGPTVNKYFVPPPYLLTAGNVYTFTIDFTTADQYYQVGAYYEVNLSFS